MRFHRADIAAVAMASLAVWLPPASIAAEDPFDFMPPGGRTLLGEAFAAGDLTAGDVLSADRSRDAWRSVMATLDKAGLDERQKDTLAAYLASTMPAADKGGAMLDTNGLDLPRDGRDLVLEYCQSCHIITVVVTQDRSREAWLGTMNKPSHVELDTTPAEREAIADYLVLNGGIPIDDIPEELRAGGATY